jgi:hypothetical protein
MLFSLMAAPLSNSVEGHTFFHILTSTCSSCGFDNSLPNRCEVIAPVVLLHISLMTNNVEHVFVYLLFICMPS